MGSIQKDSAVMVCEDDLEFVGRADEVMDCIEEFLANEQLDVLSLSGRARGGSIPISQNLRLVFGLVGRGCYVVKPHAVDPLLRRYEKGLAMLSKGDLRGKGDLMWRKLQTESLYFASPRKELARQRSGYSDIEQRELGPR